MQRATRKSRAKRMNRSTKPIPPGAASVIGGHTIKPLGDWSEFDSLWSGEMVEENLLAQILEDRQARRAALKPPPIQ